VKAAAEKSSSVRPLSSAQLSQLLSAAIEEMSAPKVKELLATHPHVLQEKDWELVMRTALKHFDPAVHDILDQDNPIFAPFWYIEQLKQKGSAPLFNALMAKMEASSTPILPLSTKNVLDELWKYALKELFNPTAAPNARLVRALVLEKDPSIANDPACFVLYERTVDDLAHTSLDRLTAEDHEFLEISRCPICPSSNCTACTVFWTSTLRTFKNCGVKKNATSNNNKTFTRCGGPLFPPAPTFGKTPILKILRQRRSPPSELKGKFMDPELNSVHLRACRGWKTFWTKACGRA